jgi:Flp pilus assembly protein TadD
MTRQFIALSLAGLCLVVVPASSAQPPAAAQQTAPAAAAAGPDDLLKQGQQLLRDGKHEAALEIFRMAADKAAAGSSTRSAANVQAGIALDLLGRYSEARPRFAQATADAPSPGEKARATRAMAMSFAFEGSCDGAAKYEGPLYESYVTEKDYFNAGEVANELARVCLESGSVDQAATWYQRGHEAGLKEPDLKPDRRDLWEFRWEHALARLAARRGQPAEAQQHVTAAKAILDKGTNPDQAAFFPYLVGYVAFYAGDMRTAIAELSKANQNDPFITSLLAQAYEKTGDKDHATELYRKVLTSSAHGPTNAYARPLAKKKLGISPH